MKNIYIHMYISLLIIVYLYMVLFEFLPTDIFILVNSLIQ